MQSGRAGLAVLLLAILVPCGGLFQVPAAPIERLVPADAFLAVSSDDAAATARQFQLTPPGKLLRAEPWKPYFAAVDESLTGCVLHLRPWFGIDWSDMAEFPVPVCICSFADGEGKPASALIIDAKGQPAAAADLADRAKKYFQRRKARVAEVKTDQGRRIVYSLAAAGAKAADDRVCLQQEGRLVLVTSRGGADRLETLWKTKKGKVLADAEIYQQVQKQAGALLAAPRDLRWHVRPLDLVRSLPAPPANGKRGQRDWRVTAEKLGIGGVEAAGGVVRLSRSQSANIEVALAAVAPRPFKRGLQLAALQPGPWRDPPTWAAADSASWLLWYRDVKPWFEGLGAAIDVQMGPGNEGYFRDFLDDLQEKPDGPQVNVRREILPLLLPAVVHVSDFGGAAPEWNPSGKRDLTILDAKETPDLEKVFRRLFAAEVDGKEVRLDTAAMHPLWAAKPGRALFGNAREKPEKSLSCLAVADKALLFSSDEALLRRVLEERSPAETLGKDPRFAAAAAYLKTLEAKETALRSYARNAPLWQWSYEELKAGNAASDDDARRALLELVLFGAPRGTPAKLTGKLPAWAGVAPALGITVASARVVPNGFAGVLSQMPAPPEPMTR